jgi:hypothetical protein
MDKNFIYFFVFILVLLFNRWILFALRVVVFRWIPTMLRRVYDLLLSPFRNKTGNGDKEDLSFENYLSIDHPYFSIKFINDERKDKILRINNPFRGVLIIGGAGSGKTETFASPIIYQSVVKGYSGIIYDFKFPDLTRIAKTAYESKYGNKKAKQFIINFENISISNRVNPLHPRYILSTSHAEEYATVIINNLMPESIKKIDFWVRSAISLLQASIWYFKEEHPEICTLPHIVNFIQSDTTLVLETLRKNDMSARLISSILTAHDRKAESQLAGVVGTLQIALNKINIPEAAYILTGDDFSLDLNDPADPKMLIVCNSPQMKETYSPLISLICTVALKMMNADNKCPSVVLLDEAPTLYIPNLEDVPATGRSRKVSVVYMAQDFSQMIDKYGKEKKDILVSNLLNQFYGRVGHYETAMYVSKLFGKEDVLYDSKSYSKSSSESSSASSSGMSDGASKSENQSVSYSWQERDALKSRNVLEFEQGQFASVLAETDESIAQLKVRSYQRFMDKSELLQIDQTKTKSIDKNYFREIIADINTKVFTIEQGKAINQINKKCNDDLNKTNHYFDDN